MKLAKLLHNPGAGDEEHSKKSLVKLIEANGFECRYASVKEDGWKDIEPEVDFLIVAGGDGTVRNVAAEILRRKLLDKSWPIALLPLGTANNIARTLNITADTREVVASWKNANRKKFDVGLICNGPEPRFFLEGFGYGLFPYLMKEMKKLDKEAKGIDTPEKELKAALELLHQIILSYEPHFCKLEVDGTDHSGKFLLAEIMNTRSIGPNLVLSPLGDPGDGELEVVLVPEQHKKKFADYVLKRLNGGADPYMFHTLKAKNVRISWEGTHLHIDDELMKIGKGEAIRIELKEGLLEFLVP